MTPAERSELGKAIEVLRLTLHEVRSVLSGVAERLEQLQVRVDERGER